MGVTSIEWTGTVLDGDIIPGFTWNPWRGCTRVSPGCARCYAETMSRRNPRVLGEWGADGKRVVGSEDNWTKPFRWDKRAAAAGVRRKVFSLSLGDWLEDFGGRVVGVKGDRLYRHVDANASAIDGSVGCTLDDARARMLDTIRRTGHLDYLLLTKRPRNWRRLLLAARALIAPEYRERDALIGWIDRWLDGDAPANVWAGTSVEDQSRADERIPALIEIPAAVRFLSVEPLLGPVDLRLCPHPDDTIAMPRDPEEDSPCGCVPCPTGRHWINGFAWDLYPTPRYPGVPARHCGIDWVIVGGESGPGARPCDLAWIRSIRHQCRAAGTAVFCKQLGARPVADFGDATVIFRDSKGGDIDEWPEDLRIREFPGGGS